MDEKLKTKVQEFGEEMELEKDWKIRTICVISY